MNLNSILIGSEDPKRLAEYYTKLFGDPGWDDGGYTGWQIGSGWMTVGPHDQVHGANAEPGRVIWNIETADVQGRVRPARGGRCDGGGGAVRRSAVTTWRPRSAPSPTRTATTSSS